MSRVQRYDVVVVGGGAMGAASAYALARRGTSVALVEQFGVAHDHGSSHGRSRIFRLAYRQPHFTRLAQRALAAWRRLEDDVAEPLLARTGGVDHGDEPAIAEVKASLDAARVRYEVLSADAARDRWPGLRFDGDVLHQRDAGRLDADAVVRALHRRGRELGADIRYDRRVGAVVTRDDGVDVVTDDEVLHAGVVVLATGAWLPIFVASLGLDVPPLTVTQEQPGYFAAPEAEPWPAFVHYDYVAHYGLFTPGFGVKVGEHGSGVVVDPDARRDVDADAVQRLSSYVEQWMPGALSTPVRVDSCLYTTTPDEEFVLTRHGRVVVCSACSGHGFKFTPVVGERVADLVLAE